MWNSPCFDWVCSNSEHRYDSKQKKNGENFMKGIINNHCWMEVATNALFMTYWKEFECEYDF